MNCHLLLANFDLRLFMTLQILCADHTSLISEVIREEITQLDNKKCKAKGRLDDEEGEADSGDDSDNDPDDEAPIENMKYHIGASQRPQTLSDLENSQQENPKFRRFRLRLSEFLNTFFQTHSIPLPGGK